MLSELPQGHTIAHFLPVVFIGEKILIGKMENVLKGRYIRPSRRQNKKYFQSQMQQNELIMLISRHAK